jgi:hypothetical protein
MIAKSSRGWAARSAIIVSIALAFGCADMRPSFAGCGGYFEAQEARALCHHAVRVEGLEAQERDAEFDKCKADPTDYLQLEELADDVDLNLE